MFLRLSYSCSVFLITVFVSVTALPVTLIDLTYEFSDKTPTFPTHTRFKSVNFKKARLNSDANDTRSYLIQDFTGSEHAGTHMDVPRHLFEGGVAVDQYPIESFTGPGVVIDIKTRALNDSNSTVTVDDITNWERAHNSIPKNAFVLMNSGWDQFWQDEKKYLGNDRKDKTEMHFPGFSVEACEWLVRNREIAAVGVDTPSVDLGTSTTFPCHYAILGKNIIILENVFNIGKLPSKGATIRAYPMKIKDGTGAPTRIIATVNEV